MVKFRLIWTLVSILPYSSLMQCCPDRFFEVSNDTCLHIAQPKPNPRAYCRRLGARVFRRPLTETMKENIAERMLQIATSWMPEKAYLGMQSLAEENSNGSTSKWRYEGTDEEFLDDEYEVWYRRPKESENCAAVGESTEYKAEPTKCDAKIPYLCQMHVKKCNDPKGMYAQYQNVCAYLNTDAKYYNDSKEGCPNGHLLNLKSKSQIRSIIEIFYNIRFAGGVYIGLKKRKDGQWAYQNRQLEAPEAFEKDNKDHFRCGAVRLLQNLELGLYSIPCGRKRLHFMCEIKIGESESNDSKSENEYRDESYEDYYSESEISG